MKRDDFTDLLQKLQSLEAQFNVTKGREYCAGDDDALRNFKQAGNLLQVRCPHCDVAHSVPPEIIALVYTFKHFTSICSYLARGHELSDEPIEGRIVDMRLYLALIAALIQEKKNEAIQEE